MASVRSTALETKQKLFKALFGQFRTIWIHVSESYLNNSCFVRVGSSYLNWSSDLVIV